LLVIRYMSKNKCISCHSYLFDEKSKTFFCNEKSINCPEEHDC
jgi:hypothetical protein